MIFYKYNVQGRNITETFEKLIFLVSHDTNGEFDIFYKLCNDFVKEVDSCEEKAKSDLKTEFIGDL